MRSSASVEAMECPQEVDQPDPVDLRGAVCTDDVIGLIKAQLSPSELETFDLLLKELTLREKVATAAKGIDISHPGALVGRLLETPVVGPIAAAMTAHRGVRAPSSGVGSTFRCLIPTTDFCRTLALQISATAPRF